MVEGSAPHAPARAAERPHAPRTGPLRRLLGPLYFTGVFWYRLALGAVRWLPELILRPLVAALSVLALLLLGGLRRALRANLALVLGPAGALEGLARTRRALHAFGWCVVERYEQFVPRKTFDVRFEGLERWQQLMEEGTGFVLVTGHIGNWELGSTIPATRQDLVVNVVREAELDPRAQALTEELLAGLGGVKYRTHFATDDMTLGARLLAALRRGEVVALQADRPRSGGATTRVALFGAPFDVPTGPAAVARLADVPLVPSFTLREGRRRYRIVFREPIRVQRTRDRDADHRVALEAVARELEEVVRDAPYQWFCLREVGRVEGAA